MTDIELVIKIPEEMYNRIALAPRCASFIEAYNDRAMFVKAIQKGTPLPKGHGRLIDADKLRPYELVRNYIQIDEFDNAPTIIDADVGNTE